MESMTDEERREFARQGGKSGGRARAAKLSAARRKEIAKKAAAARWPNAKKRAKSEKKPL